MHYGQMNKPGVTRMMAVMMRAHTIRITNKAMAIPLQFLCWVVPPTNSCKKTKSIFSNHMYAHFFFSLVCWLAFILWDQQLSAICFTISKKMYIQYKQTEKDKELNRFFESVAELRNASNHRIESLRSLLHKRTPT